MMPILRFVAWTCSAALMVLGAGAVSGQNYPNKPIRMVTSGTGGSTDIVARMIANGMTEDLGRRIVVDNRRDFVAASTVAKATPDGYTILVFGTSLWVQPLLRDVGWDPIKDFAPVSLLVGMPNILVVNNGFPARSVKELIAVTKAKPGAYNYGSSITGGTTHLAAELFKAMAGVNVVRIPYKGGGAALIDLIGGRVQMAFSTAASVMPHIKAGRVRALAVTSLQPTPLAPGLPTIAASGVPGYEATSMYGLFAPAGTPTAIINHLYQDSARVLNKPEVKTRLLNTVGEGIGSSPAEFSATVKSEMAKWGKLIKDAGIREE